MRLRASTGLTQPTENRVLRDSRHACNDVLDRAGHATDHVTAVLTREFHVKLTPIDDISEGARVSSANKATVLSTATDDLPTAARSCVRGAARATVDKSSCPGC